MNITEELSSKISYLIAYIGVAVMVIVVGGALLLLLSEVIATYRKKRKTEEKKTYSDKEKFLFAQSILLMKNICPEDRSKAMEFILNYKEQPDTD